jgi:hypothetical protein
VTERSFHQSGGPDDHSARRPHAHHDHADHRQPREPGRVRARLRGTATPAYRTLDLYFDSYEDASAAVTTPDAADLFGTLIGTEVPFKGLFSDIEQA